ncbi:hypothetical protein GmHk_04G010402 [Glycine max]|nr:hypothetical protein GmHk_04G010402 [Glycine max]
MDKTKKLKRTKALPSPSTCVGALVVGRLSLACVVCWSAAVMLENVVCGCRLCRRRPHRHSSRWRLLLVVPLKRRNSGMVGSGQPNPCHARFLK